MANWCSNSIAFYQDDEGTALVEAFHADVQKYLNYVEPDGKTSDWVGHYLQASRVDVDSMYTRGFFSSCELHGNYVLIEMETAWGPLPEVWDLMAEKYSLSYVYISEECGMSVYVNTDVEGRFFSTRYLLDYFDIEHLELPPELEAKYGNLLRELSEETTYYDDFSDVLDDFVGFGFCVDDLDGLNRCLEKFGIMVHEYSSE